MQRQQLTTLKPFLVGIVTFLIFGFLFWEHFHGGVTSHHLLHNKDLPSISNWWGGLLLPILTWFLLSRIEKRLDTQSSQTDNPISKVFGIFFIGVVLGVLLSTAFAYNYEPFLDNVLYIIIVLSFLVPVYYAEFILGFILSMTYTFGVIIPTVFILVFAVIGLVTYRLIRPFVLKLTNRPGND